MAGIRRSKSTAARQKKQRRYIREGSLFSENAVRSTGL
jgi:hypothetical protein